jgi:hypothetical protein
MTAQQPAANPAALPPRLTLYQLLTAHYVSHALYVAARLGVADHLANGPRHVDELAQATRAHGPSLNRLMRLLASAGVFTEEGPGRFALTPVGDWLRSDRPGSSRATALLFAGPTQRAWGALLYSVQTGEASFQHVTGMDPFQYFAQHPEEAAVFNDAMTAISTQVANALPAAYDFSPFGTVADVGGGHGVLLGAILRANPAARGVLFELPPVAEGARKKIAALGLSGRCEVVGGDFFESVPAGADAYILKSVIHDWDDARGIQILKNCHRAMAPRGRLLLVEMVLPDRVGPSPWNQIVTGSDVNMLVNIGGRERTDGEFRSLFEAVGFRLTRILPIEGSVACVLEGTPA